MSHVSQTQRDISDFSNRLDFSPNTQSQAEDILLKINISDIHSGKSPNTLIAVALYIAGILENEPRTMVQISQVTGVSQGTIQKRKTEIVRELGIRRE
jgi:transcription initiation factor TFIIIB Brf1 subunit/transcription initiation factor TFIIB